jgi:hypothetical protein
MLCRFDTPEGHIVHINPMLVRAIWEDDGSRCRIAFDVHHLVPVKGGRDDVIRRLDEALSKLGR